MVAAVDQVRRLILPARIQLTGSLTNSLQPRLSLVDRIAELPHIVTVENDTDTLHFHVSVYLQQVTATRGMERGDLRRQLPDLVNAIQTALDLPREECPQVERNSFPPQFTVLGQFMYAALNSLCRQRRLAASLVGTQNDVRELIALRTGDLHEGVTPRLLEGWRAEVVGNTFEDLLSGRTSIRVGDPKSDHPLILSPVESSDPL